MIHGQQNVKFIHCSLLNMFRESIRSSSGAQHAPNPATYTYPFVHPPNDTNHSTCKNYPVYFILHPLSIHPKDVTLQHVPNQHTLFTCNDTTHLALLSTHHTSTHITTTPNFTVLYISTLSSGHQKL
jgi:hypothetical protein